MFVLFVGLQERITLLQRRFSPEKQRYGEMFVRNSRRR